MYAGHPASSAAQVTDVNVGATDLAVGQDVAALVGRRLNNFNRKDLFLGRFRMLGRDERRRGGNPHPPETSRPMLLPCHHHPPPPLPPPTNTALFIVCTAHNPVAIKPESAALYREQCTLHAVKMSCRVKYSENISTSQRYAAQNRSISPKCLNMQGCVLRAGQAVVQFAEGIRDKRNYAIKFFFDEESFFAEAALYAAVFPNLKHNLSSTALAIIAQRSMHSVGDGALEDDVNDDVRDEVYAMQSAGARFLPQVQLNISCNRSTI